MANCKKATEAVDTIHCLDAVHFAHLENQLKRGLDMRSADRCSHCQCQWVFTILCALQESVLIDWSVPVPCAFETSLGKRGTETTPRYNATPQGIPQGHRDTPGTRTGL